MAQHNVLHMNTGNGETSYAKNSGLQKVIISITWSVLDETLKDMFSDNNINGLAKRMKMADLGCASGPNTLFVVSHVMETLQNLCKHNNLPAELEVFLNDLPENDFNNLFKLLPNLCPRNINNGNDERKLLECFVHGVPGSFYGRLFPSSSLHFAYSSTSVHWLSQIPEGVGKNNKESIHMAMTSPPQVCVAYAKQFHRDFFRFLSSRAEEITTGGRMVLAFLGRSFADPCSNDGLAVLLKEEDLYSFNVPIYAPCLQEVEDIIAGLASFSLDKMEVFHVPWDADYDDCDDDMVFEAGCVRAFMEPMLARHFGSSINIDGVFDVYAKKMAAYLSKHRSSSYFVPVISLTKKLKDEI